MIRYYEKYPNWKFLFVTVVLCILISPHYVLAEPTDVIVRVVSQDAKVIGSGVGGVLIMIRDYATGEILAEGKHMGGTGDTERIMRRPHVRGESPYVGENTACFQTTLDLEKPTQVEITAEGPLAYPQAKQKASMTTLLLPGQDIGEEGIVMMLHGFIVDIMNPESVAAQKERSDFTVRASVRMMCGCPTEPGGLWDSNSYKITAQLIHNEKIIQSEPLTFSGKTNIYLGKLRAPKLNGKEKDSVELRILVSDPETANFGMDQTTLMIVP